MAARNARAQLKTDLKQVFRALDFAGKHLNGRRPLKATQNSYIGVYQSLGLAWEFFCLKCKHWDGYKRTRDGKLACRICGTIKGVRERYFLLTANGAKALGKRTKPSSKKTFANKIKAQVVHDRILFHGASVEVDVHNSYKSNLFGAGHAITVAAERSVTPAESGIKCRVDNHVVDVKLEDRSMAKTKKPRYGGFPSELSKKALKQFPVIFRFDEDYKFLGLTIIRPINK
jgi:hypothetical protein